MAEAGKVIINDSVGAALRFVREKWRFVLLAAAIGAVATGALTALRFAVPQAGLLISLASTFVEAFVFAALLGATLRARRAFDASSFAESGRVWAAMLVVGFFLFIVFFVLFIPGAIVLAAGPLASYLPDLQAAGQDQGRVMAIMMRFVEQNPGPILAFLLFYGLLWLALTSRFYLAAPASLDQGRILTFETWKWTKNNMVRIMGARLMLLIPAYILASAVAFFIGSAVGVNAMNPAATQAVATANPTLFLAYVSIATFVTYSLYSALEAGLAAALYRQLRPPQPIVATP